MSATDNCIISQIHRSMLYFSKLHPEFTFQYTYDDVHNMLHMRVYSTTTMKLCYMYSMSIVRDSDFVWFFRDLVGRITYFTGV